MYKKVAVIIPALEKNRYSQDGDLVKFGDLTLLEWKLIQLKHLIPSSNIYVSTPSTKIEKIVRDYNMCVIRRKNKLLNAEVISECLKKINHGVILWSCISSPFVSANDFAAMLNKFSKLPKAKFDSLISVSKLEEFVIFKNNALNFKMTEITERKKIEPVYLVTNGCFISRREILLRYRNYFGAKPYLFELDKLAAMEIKEASDLRIANDLISLFFKRELKI